MNESCKNIHVTCGHCGKENIQLCEVCQLTPVIQLVFFAPVSDISIIVQVIVEIDACVLIGQKLCHVSL